MLEYAKKLEAYMKSGSRHPVYPWTVASRIRQFPYVWYYQNNTFVRYYVLSMPVFLPLGVYLLYKAHFIKKRLTHNYDPFNPNEIPVQKIGHH
ncbi:unnamed protein product [Hymenolepis diminuta]|uniref:Complex I-B15 n=1 Tax=Hymenolepis diminuta TaxID=6216 RepID=A0A0R3SR14_HYMDI|nr:unnamed protein product [Hymenolepis diminuta]VUZ56505.1 unnamed protein product [Hymenolepis diminuta]